MNGLRAKHYVERNEAVPCDIISQIVLERMAQRDVVQRGYLLDGFPRDLMQVCSSGHKSEMS